MKQQENFIKNSESYEELFINAQASIQQRTIPVTKTKLKQKDSIQLKGPDSEEEGTLSGSIEPMEKSVTPQSKSRVSRDPSRETLNKMKN